MRLLDRRPRFRRRSLRIRTDLPDVDATTSYKYTWPWEMISKFVPYDRNEMGEMEWKIVVWVEYGKHPFKNGKCYGPKRSRSPFDYLEWKQIEQLNMKMRKYYYNVNWK